MKNKWGRRIGVFALAAISSALMFSTKGITAKAENQKWSMGIPEVFKRLRHHMMAIISWRFGEHRAVRHKAIINGWHTEEEEDSHWGCKPESRR